jgi:hypothetical protein
MSQENVEIVRAVVDAFSRSDWKSALKDTAPNVELDLSRALGPQRGVYRGEEVQRALREFYEGWESVADRAA